MKENDQKRTPDKKDKGKRRLSMALSSKKVFGISLEFLVRRDNKPIPSVVINLLGALKKSLDEEGLFRVPGTLSAVRDLQKKIDNNEIEGDMKTYFKTLDEHVLASVLKNFLRELPEPVISYEIFQKISSVQGQKNDPKFPEIILEIIASMKRENRALLEVLLSFLVKVAEHQDKNKMSLKNLAMVFGPCLLRELPDAEPDFQAVGKFSEALLSLLEIWDQESKKEIQDSDKEEQKQQEEKESKQTEDNQESKEQEQEQEQEEEEEEEEEKEGMVVDKESGVIIDEEKVLYPETDLFEEELSDVEEEEEEEINENVEEKDKDEEEDEIEEMEKKEDDEEKLEEKKEEIEELEKEEENEKEEDEIEELKKEEVDDEEKLEEKEKDDEEKLGEKKEEIEELEKEEENEMEEEKLEKPEEEENLLFSNETEDEQTEKDNKNEENSELHVDDDEEDTEVAPTVNMDDIPDDLPDDVNEEIDLLEQLRKNAEELMKMESPPADTLLKKSREPNQRASHLYADKSIRKHLMQLDLDEELDEQSLSDLLALD